MAQNDKSWIRKRRFGSQVVAMRAGLDQIAQMMFDIVGDQGLYRDIEYGWLSAFDEVS